MTNRQGLDASHASSSGAVEALIERFGGLRPMADKLGVPVSTVQGWKKRGVIPSSRQDEVRSAAAKLGIPDMEAALEGVFRVEDRHDDGAPAPEKTTARVEARAPEVKAAAERVGEGDAVSDPADDLAKASAIEPTTTATAETPTETPAEPAADPDTEQPETEKMETVGTEAVAATTSRRDTLLAKQDAGIAGGNGTPEEVDVTQASSVAAGDDAGQAGGQSSQGTGAAIAAAVLAVIGAAVSVTAPLWSHDYLQRQVNVALIESRTANFEAALKTGVAERATLGDRMTALEAALAALDAKVAKGPAVAVVMAVKDLNGALASGEPFLDELTAVRAAGLLTTDDAKALTALLPYAAAGVPSRESLGRSFALVAPAVVGSGVTSMFLTDLPNRVWGWVSGVAGSVTMPTMPTVTMPEVSMPSMPSMDKLPAMPSMSDIGAALRLTPAGEASAPSAPTEVAAAPSEAPPAPAAAAPAPAPAPVEAPVTAPAEPAPSSPSSTALLAEAGGLLSAGDLAGAVTTMKALEGPAAKTVAGWVADAEARLAADALAGSLTRRVAASLN